MNDHISDTDEGYLTILFWMVCVGFGWVMGWAIGTMA